MNLVFIILSKFMWFSHNFTHKPYIACLYSWTLHNVSFNNTFILSLRSCVFICLWLSLIALWYYTVWEYFITDGHLNCLIFCAFADNICHKHSLGFGLCKDRNFSYDRWQIAVNWKITEYTSFQFSYCENSAPNNQWVQCSDQFTLLPATDSNALFTTFLPVWTV